METTMTIITAGLGASQAALITFAGLLALSSLAKRVERSPLCLSVDGTDAGTRGHGYPRTDASPDVLPSRWSSLA